MLLPRTLTPPKDNPPVTLCKSITMDTIPTQRSTYYVTDVRNRLASASVSIMSKNYYRVGLWVPEDVVAVIFPTLNVASMASSGRCVGEFVDDVFHELPKKSGTIVVALKALEMYLEEGDASLARHVCNFPGECACSYRQPGILNTHIRNHLGDRRYVCDVVAEGKVCGKSFVVKKQLTEHIATHTPGQFQCQGCKSTYNSAKSLADHLRAGPPCGEAATFFCTVPGCVRGARGFGTSTDLKRHSAAQHVPTLKYACDRPGCEYRSNTSCGLAQHIAYNHTFERPHVCNELNTEGEICGATFTMGCGLARHKLYKHSTERPVICRHILDDGTECGKAFVSTDVFLVHSRVHTGEMPYVCTVFNCGAAFRQVGTRNQHSSLEHDTDGKLVKGIKVHEEAAAAFLDLNGVQYERETRFDIPGGTFYRTDFLFVGAGLWINLEVDERQHKYYGITSESEKARMTFIADTLARNVAKPFPVVHIRFNPDLFYINGEKQNPDLHERQAELWRVIQEYMTAPVADEWPAVTVRYLYYDCVAIGDRIRTIRASVSDFDPSWAVE